MNKFPELLIPAGDMQKLKYAFAYGADAVYIGGKDFNLRARANNFTDDEISEAAEYAHKLGRKLYVTVNAFTRTKEEKQLKQYLTNLEKAKVDALIISDPGVIRVAREIIPNMKIHLSTQANTTNDSACKFWESLGIKRIVLARELSLEEIKEIIDNNKKMEFEIFVHGAMCISYSGRCFLSAYMAERDANRGDCAHPCRWKYAVLEEEKRPNKFMLYEEDKDKKYSYIFNTNDMCLIDKIPEIVESGAGSFKIEGRMKSLYYITCITRLYRQAMDLYQNSLEKYKENIPHLLEEANKLNNRGYTHGFYFGEPEAKDYNYNGDFDKITHYFVGQVLEVDGLNIKVLVKNNINVGDKLEILAPMGNDLVTVKSIYSLKEEKYIEKAYAGLEVILEFEKSVNVNEFSIIRAVK